MLFLYAIPPILLLLLFSNCRSLVKNIRVAQATGIKYVVVPWFIYHSLTSMLLSRTVLRFLNSILPPSSVDSWRQLVTSTWPLRLRHAPFTHLGSDTFLTVSPGGIILNTADADLIVQITSRGTDFPKPTYIYSPISIYGQNVVSSEGAIWRHHRKMTSPAFSERNNQLVWKETLDLAQTMVASWVGTGKSNTTSQVAPDTMRLSLEIIGRAGLGQQMVWDEVDDTQDLPIGHTMSFSSSFQFIASNILALVSIKALPPRLAKILPIHFVQNALQAYDNWGKYMEEMIVSKRRGIQDSTQRSTGNLISQLVQGEPASKKIPLSDCEIMGNIFVFTVAGHETSASSLHMAIMLLALHPTVQKELQKDLDRIFSGRQPSEWSLEKDLPKLAESMLGAVWNEEMRLVTPVLTIPKIVCGRPQRIRIDGNQVDLPANMMIRLCIPSVHVNPNCWPSGPPSDLSNPIFALDNLDNDLEEFKPSRWILPASFKPNTPLTTSRDTYLNVPIDEGYVSKPSTPTAPSPFPSLSTIYTPVPGSFIPFSLGPRACIGRRFAQIEILAALAVIFTKYSVELSVDNFATDVEIDDMSVMEKKEVWEKAATNARENWQKKLRCAITVQLSPEGRVGMRFVERGEERFFGV
ncbi:related to cytochrome P450 3A7 [Rhynchosporium secalis]|uniref:Related to cytochrome P450 3A7 n=1 Tax=Rhynchosporium secalis TaxID=38038 RepID=A0A1E1M6F8_RHYSE|nr:related to cytochrome P450 3A7 [Rhynchosporium secalis]